MTLFNPNSPEFDALIKENCTREIITSVTPPSERKRLSEYEKKRAYAEPNFFDRDAKRQSGMVAKQWIVAGSTP